MNLGFDWTKARVARLEALWAEGVSAKQIGYQLGCSKDAVISKARRCYCAERQSPIKREKKAATRYPRRARRVRATEPTPPTPLPPPPPRPQVVLHERGGSLPSVLALVPTSTVRTCQFPIGEPGTREFRFCGAPVERDAEGAPTGPYCAACAERCYVRMRVREEAA